MCECGCAYGYVRVWVQVPARGKKRAPDHQVWRSCSWEPSDVGGRNWPGVLWKTSKHSAFWSHFSTPILEISFMLSRLVSNLLHRMSSNFWSSCLYIPKGLPRVSPMLGVVLENRTQASCILGKCLLTQPHFRTAFCQDNLKAVVPLLKTTFFFLSSFSFLGWVILDIGLTSFCMQGKCSTTDL